MKQKESQYLLLDVKNHLEVVGSMTEKEILNILNLDISHSKFLTILRHNTVMNEQYIIIEDENVRFDDVEIWQLFHESKRLLYYVSNFGNVKRKDKRTNKSHIAKRFIDKNGNPIVKVQKINVSVKTLVAEQFVKGYFKGCYVIHKDGNKNNCSYNNLECKPNTFRYNNQYESRSTKVGRYIDGMLVETYKSIGECARKLYIDKSTISAYLKGKRKTDFYWDLRIIKDE